MACHHHPSPFVKLSTALRACMHYLTQAQCCLKRQSNKTCFLPQKSIRSQTAETQLCPSLGIRGQMQVSGHSFIYQSCPIMWIPTAYFYTNLSFEGLLDTKSAADHDSAWFVSIIYPCVTIGSHHKSKLSSYC